MIYNHELKIINHFYFKRKKYNLKPIQKIFHIDEMLPHSATELFS